MMDPILSYPNRTTLLKSIVEEGPHVMDPIPTGQHY